MWGKINSDLGNTLSKAMTGEMTVMEALDAVVERTRGVMLEAGYYTFQ